MHKNLKTPAVECLKLFPAKQHFLKWIPATENCKNQEINRIKSKQINRPLKLCTRATNTLILADLPLALTSGSTDC